MNNKNNYTPHILLLIAMLLWASAFVGIRVGLHGYSPGALALLRYLVASITMVPLYLRYRTKTKKHSISKVEILHILFLGVIGIGAYNFLLNYGEINVPAATASFIINQAPVLIVIFAALFLKERLGFMGWLGFLISCTGILLIALSQQNKIQLQSELIYIIGATIISALYTVVQKPLLVKLNGVELTAFIIWGGTAMLLIFTPQLMHDIKTAASMPTLTVIYMGIFPGVIAYTFWGLALARTSTIVAGSYLYIIPLLVTLLGWICIQEIPSMLSLIGGFTALIGSVVVQLSKNKIAPQPLNENAG